MTREARIRQSERGARLVARLAARTAHDLNNVAAVISGHVYLLRESAEPLGEALEAMETAMEHLQQLSLSLAELGGLGTDDPVPFDLNGAVRAAAQSYPAGRIALDLAADLPMMEGRPEDVTRGVRALLANAVESDGGQGPIRVSTGFTPEEGCRITVEDSGPGIPAEIRRRNLDPFHSTKGKRGRGIGFAVASAVAAFGGGSFALEDRPEGGTRAILQFGVAGQVAAPSGASDPQSNQS